MITPLVLLNRPLTPRTRLCRFLHHLPTRFLLFLLQFPICSVVVLCARLSFMPGYVVDDTRRLFAGVAPEFGGVG